MAWYWVALILFGSALGLMALGIPVAVGFFFTNVIAAVLFMGGGPGIQQIINNGFGVTLQDFQGNEKDVRSFDMPRWMIVGWIPLSFLMMAIEFARFLVRGEDFLASVAESLGS